MAEKIESINLWKKLFFGLLLITAMAILSACGGKVNTTINMENDQKGVRVMQVVYDATNEDAKKAFAEKDKIEASIKRHIPKQMVYKGITANSENYIVTFELPFSSIDEYRQKVIALIGNNYPDCGEDMLTIEHVNYPLLKGAIGSECFPSSALLSWFPSGLVSDELINGEDVSYVIDSDGTVVLNMAGKSYKSERTLGIEYGITDNGFDEVSLIIDNTNTKKPTATIFYTYDTAPGAEREKHAKEFLKSALPSDSPAKPTNASEISDSIDLERWGHTGFKAELSAESLEKLNPMISKALGKTNAGLHIGKPYLQKGEASFLVQKDIKSDFDCEGICSINQNGFYFKYKTNELNMIIDADEFKTTYETEPSKSGKDEKQYSVLTSTHAFSGVLLFPPYATNETIAAVAHGDDQFSLRVIFGYDEDTDPANIEVLKEGYAWLRPNYTVAADGNTITMESPIYNRDKLAEGLGDKAYASARITVSEYDSGWFNTYYVLRVMTDKNNVFVEKSNTMTFKVIAEGSASIVNGDDSYGPSEVVFTEETSRLQEPIATAKIRVINYIGWIILIAVLAVLLALAIVALVFRKKIVAKLTKFNQKRAAQAQARAAQAQALAQAQAQARAAQAQMVYQQTAQPVQPAQPVQQPVQPVQPVQQPVQPVQQPIQYPTSPIPPVMDDDDENDLG